MKLSEFKNIHFIGVGGIGMSALARLCLQEGKTVSGSDRALSPITEALAAEGVEIFAEQVAANIKPEYELVVYTEAMAKDHPELVAAKALGVPVVNYFAALGMVANEYYLIAVAGSHGKTTTTAMLIDIFEEANLDPSAVVGSLRAKSKSNYRAGKSKYFIVEACEYRQDFLSLTPDVLVITNLEYEHVDYYKSLEDVQAAFRELVSQIRPGGCVVINESDPALLPVIQGCEAAIVDYGKFFDPLRALKVPGIHNQMNAAAAVAAAVLVGVSAPVANQALAQFAGTWRRFEYKGEVNGVKVYDDYGHHPTEIKATLAGARELYPKKNLVLAFEAHMYSRTYELFADFVSALTRADRVILLPIYAAREENVSGVTHTALAEAVQKAGGMVTPVTTFAEANTLIRDTVTDADVVIVMGAGTITQLATDLTNK